MEKKKVVCSNIRVDCCINDPVDVRAGGPQYLGFDFYVKEDKTDLMMGFIKTSLNEFGVPLINISNNGKITVNEEDVWDENRIVNAISNEADYLIGEAAREYEVYVPKK